MPAETSPSAGQTAEFSQLKADVASAQEALRQAQLAESTLRAELDLSRANQASARESLQQAEVSIDTLQHELSLLQHGEPSPGSPDARSQQVGVSMQTTRKEEVWECCLVKVMRQLIIKQDACPNFAHPALQARTCIFSLQLLVHSKHVSGGLLLSLIKVQQQA